MDTKLISKGLESQLINTDFRGIFFASFVSEVHKQKWKSLSDCNQKS